MRSYFLFNLLMPNAYLLGVGNVLLVMFNFWDLPSSKCEIFNPFSFPLSTKIKAHV
jgi:hypothetical protein